MSLCLLTASNGTDVIEDTLWVSMDEPLMAGELVVLDAFQLDVPEPGNWELTLALWSLNKALWDLISRPSCGPPVWGMR